MLLCLVSCKQKPAAEQNQAFSHAYENNDIGEGNEEPLVQLDSLIHYFKQQYDRTPEELLKAMGKPLRIDSTRIQNVHTGKEEDYVYKFEFPGKMIVLYYATEIHRYFLELVEVRNVQELASFGITNEVTPLRLRELLGTEAAVHQSPEGDLLYQYTFQQDVEENIFFIFNNNTLKAVQYQPYLD